MLHSGSISNIQTIHSLILLNYLLLMLSLNLCFLKASYSSNTYNSWWTYMAYIYHLSESVSNASLIRIIKTYYSIKVKCFSIQLSKHRYQNASKIHLFCVYVIRWPHQWWSSLLGLCFSPYTIYFSLCNQHYYEMYIQCYKYQTDHI